MNTPVNLRKKQGIFALLVSLAGILVFIFYAASPAVSSKQFPASNILHFSEESYSSPSLKIVTYNMGYASGEKNNLPLPLTRAEVVKNLQNIVLSLKVLHPDILLLQEVDFKASRTFNINQMEYLAKALQMPYGAYAVTWNKQYLPWPYWPPQYQFGKIVSGQAILSRLPILKQELLKFPKPSSNPFWYNWFYLDRVAQKVTLQNEPQNFMLWNVHLEAFDAETRFSQIQAFAKWIQQEPSPWKLVAGDFNTSHLESFVNKAQMEDSQTDPSSFTFSSFHPFEQIDHVFYDPHGWEPLAKGLVSNLYASDHLPVWAELKFVKPNS